MESTVNPDALFQTMQITFFSNGINYPVAAFKDRLQFTDPPKGPEIRLNLWSLDMVPLT